MEYQNKVNLFIDFSNKYVDVINKILDFSIIKKILPLKILLGMSILKKYIVDNKISLIQNGVKYLLNHKETILNFNLNNLDDLDELDNDSDDNISRKNCMTNINKVKEIIDEQSYENDEILNLIIEIKNNAKVLNDTDKIIIKGYIEVLIMILEKIKNIFI